MAVYLLFLFGTANAQNLLEIKNLDACLALKCLMLFEKLMHQTDASDCLEKQFVFDVVQNL